MKQLGLFLLLISLLIFGYWIYDTQNPSMQDTPDMRNVDEVQVSKEDDLSETPELLALVSKQYKQAIVTKKIEPGTVIEFEGEKESATKRHLALVKDVKTFILKSCQAAKGDLAKIQENLNTYSKSMDVRKKYRFRKVALGIKFVDSNCKGILSVQSDFTIQEVKF